MLPASAGPAPVANRFEATRFAAAGQSTASSYLSPSYSQPRCECKYYEQRKNCILITKLEKLTVAEVVYFPSSDIAKNALVCLRRVGQKRVGPVAPAGTRSTGDVLAISRHLVSGGTFKRK